MHFKQQNIGVGRASSRIDWDNEPGRVNIENEAG